MLDQKTVPASEILDYDGIVFGNEMYRVYYATPNDGGLIKAWTGGKNPKIPEDHIEVALISDQRIDTANKIMIHLTLHKNHPVTVVRVKR